MSSSTLAGKSGSLTITGRARARGLAVAASAFLLASCGEPAALRESRRALGWEWDDSRLFASADNVFKKPVPADAKVHPGSAAMVALLKEACGPDAANTRISVRQFAIAAYLAPPEARRKSLRIYRYNMPPGKKRLLDVPVLPGSRPAKGTDMSYALIDPGRGAVYEFWMYSYYRAASGNAIPLDGPGIYADGRSAVAAGFSCLQGLIWPKELREGRIPHALQFTCPVTMAEGYVPPATHNDGALRGRPDAIPEGTLFRIRPDFDLDAMPGIGPIERTVYRAIQEYGMYCGDTNGAGLDLRGLAEESVDPAAWPEGFDFDTEFGTHVLRNFPFDRLEAIDAGPLIPSPAEPRPYVDHGVAKWK